MTEIRVEVSSEVQETDYMVKYLVRFPNKDIWCYTVGYRSEYIFRTWWQHYRHRPGVAASIIKRQAIETVKLEEEIE